MKKRFISCLVLLIFVLGTVFAACRNWENPGDKLGGGGIGDIAEAVDTTKYDEIKNEAKEHADLSALASNTSESGATTVAATSEIVQISDSGTYLFKGTYGGIFIAKEKLTLHFIFDGATIQNNDGVAIDGTVNKKTVLTITLKEGTTNTVENAGVDAEGEGLNAIHIKGSLSFNGKGALNVVSNSKSALKASKEIQIVDATLNLTADNHGIAGAAVVASNCTINVTKAGKDGINAECDEAKAFALDDGYVVLSNVNYTCKVTDDGIQTNTVAYIDGGSYDITAKGKGVKISEIAYTEKDSNGNKIDKTVTDGYYLIAIADGTFTINSTDDAIHTNIGNTLIEGGTFEINTKDDAITADNLVKITDGNINVTESNEGIEGAYVEISGGTISIVSRDDGINASSEDSSVKNHVIISGGEVTVNSGGDGIDSNGSILISGGVVVVHGPITGRHAGLDSDNGIVVDGGTLFAASTLGMVETPASNSMQNVVSYAHQSKIPAGAVVSLRDSEGNVLISVTVLKQCQSIIMSCADLELGSTYYVYGGDKKMATFKVSSTITTVGSTGGSFPKGGGSNARS